ncbi:hypothetical protein ACFFSW_17070 [Saccharothrix longispora]|uniref:DUF4242 domain-containing protein n=1 Tax=Saccharothrix longispora TaxID=33920 RepID=A0ABU1PT69_9PSEU|nr:hypothetical protein [Saccharothrix longispora]MDR6593646.1 hypothetical protein [Saccharothrix longispora]
MTETAEQWAARLFLVECYLPGADPDEVAGAVRGVLVAGLGAVELACCLAIPGDDSYFCLLTGNAPGELETAFRGAGVPFERIVEVNRVPLAPTGAVLPQQGERCAVRRA